MKALLEFDLDNPDDRIKHLVAIKSQDLLYVICDYFNHLRNIIKYNSDKLPEELIETYISERDTLFKILNENGINLDELVL